ncbi:MAG: thioredoxin domain-containing protein, partial [Desulfoprunum sp.]|nr:thioredoxin domain-containing protein [Desulfoprunum sp.]
AGEVVIAKLDTTQHARSASLYGIRGVPTLLFFRGGKIVDQIVGAPAESLLVSKIKALVGVVI